MLCKAYTHKGIQCSRKSKENSEFCGTHQKNKHTNPHLKRNKIIIHKIEFKGIQYYVDKNNNVYEHIDVINEVEHIKTIGTYKDGVIYIF